MFRVTVSGPFRRAPMQVAQAVGALRDAGAEVLSPREPRVVDAFGPFVFVESDRSRTIRTVQDAHLEAITRSDMLWLVAPDGHLGDSAALEVGWAMHAGVPVMSGEVLADLTYRQYVQVVLDEAAALERLRCPRPRPWTASLLLEPETAVADARATLEVVQGRLLRPAQEPLGRDLPLESALRRLRQIVRVPTRGNADRA